MATVILTCNADSSSLSVRSLPAKQAHLVTGGVLYQGLSRPPARPCVSLTALGNVLWKLGPNADIWCRIWLIPTKHDQACLVV